MHIAYLLPFTGQSCYTVYLWWGCVSLTWNREGGSVKTELSWQFTSVVPALRAWPAPFKPEARQLTRTSSRLLWPVDTLLFAATLLFLSLLIFYISFTICIYYVFKAICTSIHLGFTRGTRWDSHCISLSWSELPSSKGHIHWRQLKLETGQAGEVELRGLRWLLRPHSSSITQTKP